MHKNDRTLWTEGMFLGPQHFQQQDRFLLNTLAMIVQGLGAHVYGMIDFKIETAALKEGKFALRQASGIFPDGTPFNLPDGGDLPSPILINTETRNTVVSLAIPFEEQQDKDVAELRTSDSFSRYVINDRLVSDRHSPDSNSEDTVFTASLWTRLSLAGDDHTAFHTIPLARIVEKRNDESVILDPVYLPCAMSLKASPSLQSMVGELLGLVSQRANDLAERIGNVTASDSSQLNKLLLLQILNRASPLLKHVRESDTLHPETLYRELIQLSGELATITRTDKLAAEAVQYLHRDQHQSFAPLMDQLRESLNWIPDSKTESFEVIHFKPGIYTAAIKNTQLFQNSRFILAAKSKVTPEELSQQFPRQTTLSSKTSLRALVEAQRQGIVLNPVVTVPNSIPTYENFVYFDMRSDDPLWKDIALSGDIAMHIAGNHPELQMKIWVIRQ